MNQSRKSCAVLIALLVALIALFAGSLFFLVKIQLHKKSPKRSKPAAAETAVPNKQNATKDRVCIFILSVYHVPLRISSVHASSAPRSSPTASARIL